MDHIAAKNAMIHAKNAMVQIQHHAMNVLKDITFMGANADLVIQIVRLAKV